MIYDNPSGARIYNLFPRLLGPMSRWMEHLAHIKYMEFDWVFINPFHYPGFSGSLYAVKDYYAFNPLFLSAPGADGWREFGDFIRAAHGLGLKVMMDLVINHTAIDCELTQTHPAWYLRNRDGSVKNPSCIDPADASKVTVWGDLAEIDNHHSPDRQGLWDYWDKLVQTYLEAGVDGFRCDAAYQVPTTLWRRLINSAKSKKPVLFFAETLGCTEEKLAEIAQSGFDYVYNSSKWWDFSAPWCIAQYNLTRPYAASVSFPESHDTERLAQESGGDRRVSEMRYLFAALFSTGVMLPIGYEYGFRRRLNVVHTTPADWESVQFDLTDFIRRVNRLKSAYPIFNEDNPVHLVTHSDPQIAILHKVSLDGRQSTLLIINRDQRHSRQVHLNIPGLLGQDRQIKDISPDGAGLSFVENAATVLQPNEIKVVLRE